MYFVQNADTNEIIRVRAASSLEAMEFAAEEHGWTNMEAWR